MENDASTSPEPSEGPSARQRGRGWPDTPDGRHVAVVRPMPLSPARIRQPARVLSLNSLSLAVCAVSRAQVPCVVLLEPVFGGLTHIFLLNLQPGSRVFISYVEGESAEVYTALHGILRGKGFSVFHGRTQLVKSTTDEMRDFVRGANVFIAVLSPGYFRSKYCRAEADEAINSGVGVIPVFDGDTYPYRKKSWEVTQWKDIATLDPKTGQDTSVDLRKIVYKENLVRVIDTMAPDNAICSLIAAIGGRCPGIVSLPIEEAPTLPSSSPCDVYVAVDRNEDNYTGILKTIYTSMQAHFADGKGVNVSVMVGAAQASKVYNPARKGPLSSLLWLATGADLATDPKEGTSGNFVLDLESKGIKVDLAFVCMKFGAKWAAQQLCRTVAKTVVWINANAEDINSTELLNDVAALCHNILQRAAATVEPSRQPTPLQDLCSAVDAAWEESSSQAGYGVETADPEASPATLVLDKFSGNYSRLFGVRAGVPPGGYFDGVLTGPHTSTIPTVDIAHLSAARDATKTVGRMLKAKSGPHLVHVAPAWESQPSPRPPHDCVQGVLHYLCGALSPRARAQFICEITLVDGKLLDESLETIPRDEPGIIWINVGTASLVEEDVASKLTLRIESLKLGAKKKGMASWVFGIGTHVKCASSCDHLGDESNIVSLRAAPIGNKSRYNLLRLTDAAGKDPQRIREVLKTVVPTNDESLSWIDGFFVDGNDVIVRVLVHSLEYLQQLREAILYNKLAEALQVKLGREVGLDLFLFSALYNDILLEFETLTHHQINKMAEWTDEESMRIVGPAGKVSSWTIEGVPFAH